MGKKGTRTITGPMVRQKTRTFVSSNMFDKALPDDLRNWYGELVVVERFYPEKNMARVYYRDTLGEQGVDPVPVNMMVGSPFISDKISIRFNPPGTPEICPYTGWPSKKVELGSIVGFALAIKGDQNGKGSVILCFVRMDGENAFTLCPEGITVENDQLLVQIDEKEVNVINDKSSIRVTDSEIDIDAPTVKIKGQEIL